MGIISNICSFWEKHDTQILTVIGVVGAIATPILASKATLEAKEVVDDYKKEVEPERVSEETDENAVKIPWHKARKVWKKLIKIYIPTALALCVTVASIIFCHKIHIGHEASLAAMSAFWEGRYRLMEQKTTDRFGKEAVSEIRKEINEEEKKNGKTNPKENLLKEFWVYDKITKQRFKTCANNFIWANKAINEQFAKGYKVTWSYVINLLGGKKTALGDGIGFDPDNDEFIDYLDYNSAGYFGYYWFDVYADILVDEKANATLNGTVIPTIGSNVEPWDILPFK